MSMDYKDVLKRLREEREKMSWSQTQMCQRMHMSQAQYCKIEKGTQYFSYDEVNALTDLGMDVHYIFTGHRAEGCYREEFGQCSYFETVCLLEAIFSVITYYYVTEPSAFWKNLYQELRFVRLLDADQNFDNNLFFLTRRLLDYTQKEMADHLSIDVKKLRKLENDQCLPDSELLWRFYSRFRVSPSMVLKDRKGLLYEAEWFLERMENVPEKNILAVLKTCHKKN